MVPKRKMRMLRRQNPRRKPPFVYAVSALAAILFIMAILAFGIAGSRKIRKKIVDQVSLMESRIEELKVSWKQRSGPPTRDGPRSKPKAESARREEVKPKTSEQTKNKTEEARPERTKQEADKTDTRVKSIDDQIPDEDRRKLEKLLEKSQ